MKEKNRKRQLTLIMIISMILIFFFSGFSMGKGISKTKIEANSKIAEPILEVESDKAIEITKVADKGYYTFKVKNYKETGEITQVDLEYYIEILSPIPKDIQFKIYRDTDELEIRENKTTSFLLTKEEQEEHSYLVEISCNPNTVIEEIMQEIQIKVHSEQKKA